MCIDELKQLSDDSYYTEDHIKFLCSKYRAFLLKQRYSDVRKPIPTSNYQNLCLDLERVNAVDGQPCTGGQYLRTTVPIPSTIGIGNDRVYPLDYYQGEITYVSKERMRYVGNNKFLQNFIYCSKAPDGHLYFTSINPQFLYLKKVRFYGVFEDAEEASELECGDNGEKPCDIMDREFPLEAALVNPVISLVVKELAQVEYAPEDKQNNADDNLSDVNTNGKS